MITEKLSDFEPKAYASLRTCRAMQIDEVFLDEEPERGACLAFEGTKDMLSVGREWYDRWKPAAGGWVSEDNSAAELQYFSEAKFFSFRIDEPASITFTASATHNRKTQDFHVLSMVTNALNGRAMEVELNNGRVTIWRDPKEVRLFAHVNGVKVEVTI